MIIKIFYFSFFSKFFFYVKNRQEYDNEKLYHEKATNIDIGSTFWMTLFPHFSPTFCGGKKWGKSGGSIENWMFPLPPLLVGEKWGKSVTTILIGHPFFVVQLTNIVVIFIFFFHFLERQKKIFNINLFTSNIREPTHHCKQWHANVSLLHYYFVSTHF